MTKTGFCKERRYVLAAYLVDKGVNTLTQQDTTGHHTNLFISDDMPKRMSCDKAVSMFKKAGVPLEKMVLGAAFYGRMWKGVKNVNNGLNQKAETTGRHTVSYTDLTEHYINKNGFTRYWDDNAKAPYLFSGDVFISYDDAESLSHKARYVKEGVIRILC